MGKRRAVADPHLAGRTRFENLIDLDEVEDLSMNVNFDKRYPQGVADAPQMAIQATCEVRAGKLLSAVSAAKIIEPD